MSKFFACESKVRFKSSVCGIYTVKMIKSNKESYIYLLESDEDKHQYLAFHEELELHNRIEVGDMIGYKGSFYFVDSIINSNTISVQGRIATINTEDVSLVTRAKRSELLNAIHNLYGGTIKNLGMNEFKMGDVKEIYGSAVVTKILSNRTKMY